MTSVSRFSERRRLISRSIRDRVFGYSVFSRIYSLFTVIQSEAKDLDNAQVPVSVDVFEILHYTSFRSE